MMCSKATLQSISVLQKAVAVPYAKTFDCMHALVNALQNGANISILKYLPDVLLSLQSCCAWPVLPLPLEFFGSHIFSHMVLTNDEEKASFKTGLLLKGAGMRVVQKRDIFHRVNLNLVESWRVSGANGHVAKLCLLVKTSRGPFGKHGNKTTKLEMYHHLLETYSADDSVFTDHKEDFSFDWGISVSLLSNEAVYERVEKIGMSEGTAGGDVKNTRWMSLVHELPQFDPGWTADKLAFEHYMEVTFKAAAVAKKADQEDGHANVEFLRPAPGKL